MSSRAALAAEMSPTASAVSADETKAALLAAIPRLRAFAVSLCGRQDRADDLVQEALVKAWANLGSFAPGSNMAAWLYTILRNEFYTEFRKRRREVADSDGTHAAKLVTHASQESHMQFLDFREAMARLPHDHREALILVGASGLSYEEAAGICKCAVGTMKSRVNRARVRLAGLLAESAHASTGPDNAWQAAVDAPATTVFRSTTDS
jgi:RNA polymerase sigma-70 factor (ECF subfamily)